MSGYLIECILNAKFCYVPRQCLFFSLILMAEAGRASRAGLNVVRNSGSLAVFVSRPRLQYTVVNVARPSSFFRHDRHALTNLLQQ
jgi:hypothetical protein